MSNGATKQVRFRPVHRAVTGRVVVTGRLVLESPASLGNGDAEAWTDMPLLRDEADGKPLLTGASLTGALRNYLREHEFGYARAFPEEKTDQDGKEAKEQARQERKRERQSLAVALFGVYSGDEGAQGPLIVHDARSDNADYELRDGVKIDPKTRTAEDKKKFDLELLAAGTAFNLRFELLIAQDAHQEKLLQALATALDGLAHGEITLGARKRRGFGRCGVKSWTVQRFNFAQRDEWLAWLVSGRAEDSPLSRRAGGQTVTKDLIATALGTEIRAGDTRRQCVLEVDFGLAGSLMVRSGFGEADLGADMVHLHSYRAGADGERTKQRRPILPGTSWAGAWRSRAAQIARTLERRGAAADKLIERMFGAADMEKAGQAETEKTGKTNASRVSRVTVRDTEITGGRRLRQTRVKIDRFTGGAFESALFDEEPIYGGDNTRLKFCLTLRTPFAADDQQETADACRRAEIGLLLLTLKDFWTGDAALGGEIGIGRGRLAGRKATLQWDGQTWVWERAGDKVSFTQGQPEELEKFVTALREELGHA